MTQELAGISSSSFIFVFYHWWEHDVTLQTCCLHPAQCSHPHPCPRPHPSFLLHHLWKKVTSLLGVTLLVFVTFDSRWYHFSSLHEQCADVFVHTGGQMGLWDDVISCQHFRLWTFSQSGSDEKVSVASLASVLMDGNVSSVFSPLTPGRVGFTSWLCWWWRSPAVDLIGWSVTDMMVRPMRGIFWKWQPFPNSPVSRS